MMEKAALVLALCFAAATLAGAAPKSTGLAPVSDLKPSADLPDPLVMLDGTRVTSKKQWEKERRPELKLLFQHYMYGMMPPAPTKVSAAVDWEDPQAFGGKATLKEMTLRFGSGNTPPLHLLVAVPNGRKKPAPVFLGMNFQGNHAVLSEPRIHVPDPSTLRPGAQPSARGSQVDVWNIERSIDRGYAVATFYSGEIEPDNAEIARKGGRGPQDTGTICRWAWGFSRGVDYLLTDKSIDGKKIAAVGHSRNGKAAMVATAFDERIAMAIPLQAGCGGTAPSRGKIGESVTRINTSFPHWFADEFKLFNDRPELLPFDQHCLVALAAPRPVLFSCASEDTWANPEGQFQVLKAATPVYRLLGVEGLEADTMSALGKLVPSRLGYFIRAGKHSMSREDWDAFLDFADHHFGAPKSAPLAN